MESRSSSIGKDKTERSTSPLPSFPLMKPDLFQQAEPPHGDSAPKTASAAAERDISLLQQESQSKAFAPVLASAPASPGASHLWNE